MPAAAFVCTPWSVGNDMACIYLWVCISLLCLHNPVPLPASIPHHLTHLTRCTPQVPATICPSCHIMATTCYFLFGEDWLTLFSIMSLDLSSSIMFLNILPYGWSSFLHVSITLTDTCCPQDRAAPLRVSTVGIEGVQPEVELLDLTLLNVFPQGVCWNLIPIVLVPTEGAPGQGCHEQSKCPYEEALGTLCSFTRWERRRHLWGTGPSLPNSESASTMIMDLCCL